MKTRDTWATWETELQIQRQEIIEQAGSLMIRFAVGSTIHLLPYSRLIHVECQVKEEHHLIRAIWPGVAVSIEGYHLDSLLLWLAEHRLHSVTFLADVGAERPAGHPYIERISFTCARSATTCVNLD